MGWDRGQRIFYDALIGYTDGNFSFREPTVPQGNPFGPGGRYRPQQVKGTMGNLGQLVYNLTERVGSDVDPRIRCRLWAMKEPDPTEWTKALSTCPCTRTQVLEDLSFLQDTTDPDLRVKTLRGQRWGGTGGHIFQSILPNKYGSGKRCVYDPEGPLLAGYSERYFSRNSIQMHIGNTPCGTAFLLQIHHKRRICSMLMCFQYMVVFKIVSVELKSNLALNNILLINA